MAARSDFDVNARIARASATRAAVENASDDQVLSLLDDAGSGWGSTRRTEFAGHRMFVKRVPVTERELSCFGSTVNLFEIPSYLNYPFGSPGLGVGRELAFAIKATTWVENGECAGFPILIHHRVIRRANRAVDTAIAGNYTAYRFDEPALNAYLNERARAPADLIMCFEDIAHNAADWITHHPNDAPRIVDDIRATIAFLQTRGIVHFDTDLFNVLTDGQRTFVGDYGLVLDAEFDLSAAERRFLLANRHFDHGNVILGLGQQLYWMYRSCPVHQSSKIEAELELAGVTFEVAVERLIEAAEELDRSELLAIGSPLLTELVRYADVIASMHKFFAAARADWSSRTVLDDETLAALLEKAD